MIYKSDKAGVTITISATEFHALEEGLAQELMIQELGGNDPRWLKVVVEKDVKPSSNPRKYSLAQLLSGEATHPELADPNDAWLREPGGQRRDARPRKSEMPDIVQGKVTRG